MSDADDDYHPDHIEVSGIDDQTGLNIWVRDNVVLKISWEQAQSLNTLLCVEIDQWMHRQGLWSPQITTAGPVQLHADDEEPISPAAFADGVLDEVPDLDDESRDEAHGALSAWWGKWTDQPVARAQTDRQP